MKVFIPILATLLATSSYIHAQTLGIPEALLQKFQQITLIITSTPFEGLCAYPGGLPVLEALTSPSVDVYAWLLLDIESRELQLVFRGAQSLANVMTFENDTLVPFDILPACEGCLVHGGAYQLWTAVVDNFTAIVQNYHAQFPDYNIIISGASSGAGLASLAAATWYTVFDNLTIYTMGQPRTGNQAYANYIDTAYTTSSLETTKFYRTTHTNDGVPNVPPLSLGYWHHGLEIWNLDPTGVNNTWVCGAETTECNGGSNTTGVNLAHLMYWNYTYIISADCSNPLNPPPW